MTTVHESMKESTKEVRSICQPDSIFVKATFVNRIHRRFSIYFTILFIHLRLSANAVTLVGTLLGLSSVLPWILSADIKLHIISVVLLQLSYLLDHCDGEVARYWKFKDSPLKSKNSLSGSYCDTIAHFILLPTVIFFFVFRLLHYYPQWGFCIPVCGFFTVLFSQALPNHVLNLVLLTQLRANPELIKDNSFQTIICGCFNPSESQDVRNSLLRRLISRGIKLYKHIGSLGIISLEIPLEAILFYFGYKRQAGIVALLTVLLLFLLSVFNYFRQMRINYRYLIEPR